MTGDAREIESTCRTDGNSNGRCVLRPAFHTLVLLLGIAIVTLVGKWKVYAKLGMPGWYSLIPVFSDYKLCERVRGGEENKTFLMAYLIVLMRTQNFRDFQKQAER